MGSRSNIVLLDHTSYLDLFEQHPEKYFECVHNMENKITHLKVYIVFLFRFYFQSHMVENNSNFFDISCHQIALDLMIKYSKKVEAFHFIYIVLKFQIKQTSVGKSFGNVSLNNDLPIRSYMDPSLPASYSKKHSIDYPVYSSQSIDVANSKEIELTPDQSCMLFFILYFLFQADSNFSAKLNAADFIFQKAILPAMINKLTYFAVFDFIILIYINYR